jgi:hypothetical protein
MELNRIPIRLQNHPLIELVNIQRTMLLQPINTPNIIIIWQCNHFEFSHKLVILYILSSLSNL